MTMPAGGPDIGAIQTTRRGYWLKQLRRLPPETGVVFVLVLAVVYLSLTQPYFLTEENLRLIAKQSAGIGILAVGMTFVIAIGGIDISVGSVVGFCSLVLGALAVLEGWSLPAALLACLAAGALCGLINGVIIARAGMPSIIATLAMFAAARAGALVVHAGGHISNIPSPLVNMAQSDFAGVPVVAWIAGVVAVAGIIILNRTRVGRQVLALGGNREASRMSGVKIDRIEIAVYTVMGMLAGLAAIITTARGATADPNAGTTWEFQAITAVVLGGTPIIGGSASVIGSILGVLTLTVLRDGVTLANLDSNIQQLIIGAALLLAVEVERWRVRRARSVGAKLQTKGAGGA